MSGILGLNAVEVAASKGMGIGSFRTVNNEMMTIMRNPKTKILEYFQHPLGTDISQSNHHGITNLGENSGVIMTYLKGLAQNTDDFEKAAENCLRLIV